VSTRILLVRAVNVGGVKLPMAEFRSLLAELGASDVRTYVASGNAVLDVPGEPDEFDRAVEAAMEQRFGFRREVMSREPEEVRAALAAHPFEVVDAARSYVTFLSGAPTPAAIDSAADVVAGADEWRVVGRDLHVRFEEGAGRATLDVNALYRRLGVAGTARNLRTVTALVRLAGS
jgi:uncharacterized protein (DUF1697 family)